jgi:hypothetical protein
MNIPNKLWEEIEKIRGDTVPHSDSLLGTNGQNGRMYTEDDSRPSMRVMKIKRRTNDDIIGCDRTGCREITTQNKSYTIQLDKK